MLSQNVVGPNVKKSGIHKTANNLGPTCVEASDIRLGQRQVWGV
jgi:hypothetical protein